MDSIDATQVNDILTDCLFRDDEISNGAPIDGVEMSVGKGIQCQFGFNKDRVDGHKETIKTIISLLPDDFKKGCSFLNMCVDKSGKQWGEHRNCDELLALGNAIGAMSIIDAIPAHMLPGGMPYVQVTH